MNGPGGRGSVERVYARAVAPGAEMPFVDAKYLPTGPEGRDRGVALEYIADSQQCDLKSTRGGGRRTGARSPAEKSALPPQSSDGRADALGLVHVVDPHQTSCTSAVARARTLRWNPRDGTFVDAPADADAAAGAGAALPRRVLPGRVLGRSSSGRSSSRPRPDFLDLGIHHTSSGVSRRHVKMMEVSNSESSPPSLLIEVEENATNGVHVHCMRHGKRTHTYLPQGEQATLLVGDAIEFLSSRNISFCVVGLLSDQGESGAVDTAARGTDGGKDGAGGVGSRNAVRTLESTSPPEKEQIGLPLARETGNMTVRKRKRKKREAPVAEDYDQDVVLLVVEDDAKARSDGKEDVDGRSGQQRIPATKPQSPMAADNTLAPSPIKKSAHATISDIESCESTEIAAASAAERLASPATSPSPPSEKKEGCDPLGNDSRDATMALVEDSVQDLCSTGADGESGDNPCETKFTPELTGQEKEHASMSVDSKPLAAAKKEFQPAKAGASPIRKGDEVEVLSGVDDMFGVSNLEWFDCTVVKTRPDSTCVRFNDGVPKRKTNWIPSNTVRTPDKQWHYPESFSVGDVVDAKFQDKQWWYRGRVAQVGEDGTCSIMYYDSGDYETNIPTKEKKIRLSRRFDSNGQWLMDKSVLLKGADNRFRTGTVSRQSGSGNYDGSPLGISFPDGSSERVCYIEVVNGVFLKLIQQKHDWPGSTMGSLAERVKRRRQEKENKKEIKEALSSQAMKPAVKVEKRKKPVRVKAKQNPPIAERTTRLNATPAPFVAESDGSGTTKKHAPSSAAKESPLETATEGAPQNASLSEKRRLVALLRWEKQRAKANATKLGLEGRGNLLLLPAESGASTFASDASSDNVAKAVPVDTRDEVDTASLLCLDQEMETLEGLYAHGPAIAQSVLEKRKIAEDLPPGLPNVLWCALNSPEAQTGASLLRNMLCVHDAVPNSTMVRKLMELMKYGPKAEGLSVHFKDPHRTELAVEYVNTLVSASSCLVRQDSGALFGPSSWDDIEVLLSQSTAETENMISGRRLSQGLHLAARGAKLLSLMLRKELQGYDLYSTSSVSFDSEPSKAMPSVHLIKSHGVHYGLIAAVQHATNCLVRHSRWVMDHGDLNLSPASAMSTSDECCALEARACLDSLGSTICLIAWLFCVEERFQIMDCEVALVIKDAFLAELEHCLEDVPEMKEQNKIFFVKRLKMCFLLSLNEDFCTPMVVTLGNMIGSEDELALVGLVA